MKIRLSELKRLIREAAVTSLGSSQGFRAAGLAARGLKAGDFVNARSLAAEVVDGYNVLDLRDTLEHMLDNNRREGYLAPDLAAYISEFLEAIDALGRVPARDRSTADAALNAVLRQGIAGLYDAGAGRQRARGYFKLLGGMGPGALRKIAGLG